MMVYRRRMHEKEPEIDWNHLPVSQTEHLTQVYDIRFPKGMVQFPHPFPICPV